jgi:ubiquinol-cytochrome c reductase iron-sulfur subunit
MLNMANTADNDADDVTRRDFIHIAAAAFAGIGAAAALWPLIDQMNPDAAALSLASIEVDLTPIEEGQAITAMWQGKPVFVRNRTQAEIAAAKAVSLSDLKDPTAQLVGGADLPATDENRTKPGQEKWLVLIGVCTHLGCIPKGQRSSENRGEFGGWFCPCHGSHYDTAGRIRKGPAPANLPIPPYQFVSDTKIKIG